MIDRMRQKGFSLLVYAIAAAAALAMLYALVSFVDKSWETSAGVERGRSEAFAEVAKRDNKALEDVIVKQRAAESRVAELEAKNAVNVAKASTAYQKGLQNGKAELDSAVARVHAGYRLRDPGSSGSAANCPGDAPSAPSTATARRDGEAGTYLSSEASSFLLKLAGEADDTVRQLIACQAVVIADRETASP